ncbi:hypothetical protein Tco_1562677 [Tanacetum coccineum]
MADQNVLAQAPTRTDEQILPRSAWLQIGKRNLLFGLQKIQKNPIFQISVDILCNTNFFKAFSASASVPAIYIQQFGNTIKYGKKTEVYSCQVDEQWFNLSDDLPRNALEITPVDPAHPFELPPPWRAILSLINMCLTRKTSDSDKPRHPVLQMFHEASLKDPKKKPTHLLIPYGQFTKMIIYYLASKNNIHRRPESTVHHTGDDFLLGNLKFVPKGETDEVFGMAIPKQLITEAIQ